MVERRTRLLAEGGIEFHLELREVGGELGFAELRAAPRRAVRRHRRLPGARHRDARASGSPTSCRRSTFWSRATARAWATPVPAFDSGALERRRQAGRGDRRRRHRDGLRAHRGAPGRRLGDLPLPPRPRQHAGLDARGEARRGGGRRVRLAGGARGLPRRRRGDAACARCGCASARPTPTGRQRPEPIPGSQFDARRPTW